MRKLSFKRFAGMMSEEVVQVLRLEQEMFHQSYSTDFMKWFKQHGAKLSTEWLRYCADNDVKNCNRFHVLMAYAERTGDREKLFRYLVRTNWLSALRKHFSERLTPQLLRSIAERNWAQLRKEPNGVKYSIDAYEAYQLLGDEEAAAAVRAFVVNRGQCSFFGLLPSLHLDEAEREILVSVVLKSGRHEGLVERCVKDHHMVRFYRAYLEAKASTYGYRVWLEEGPELGITPTVKHLLALAQKQHDIDDEIKIYRVLAQRNPKYQTKVRALWLEKREHYLGRLDVERAMEAATEAGQPLTPEELLAASHTSNDEEAQKALNLAAKLIVAQLGDKPSKRARKLTAAA